MHRALVPLLPLVATLGFTSCAPPSSVFRCEQDSDCQADFACRSARCVAAVVVRDDAGVPLDDAGPQPREDAGPSGIDAGRVDSDAGFDAGAPLVDAGFDAGAPPADAGAPVVDAGSDAGAPVVDAGYDAGAPAVDAGVDAGFDAGAPVVDAGYDAGAPIADAGPPPTCGTLQTLRDDFNDNDRAGIWDYSYNGPSGTYIEENGDQARIYIDQQVGYAGFQSAYALSIRGSQVSVELAQLATGEGGQQMIFSLGEPEGDYVQFVQELGSVAIDKGDGSPVDVEVNPTDQAWRFREAGGVLYFDARRQNGWTTLDSMATPVWADRAYVALIGGRYAAGGSFGHVAFDNLNTDTTQVPWCPAETFVETFDSEDAFDRLGEGLPGCGLVVEDGRLKIEHSVSGRCSVFTRTGLDLDGSQAVVQLHSLPSTTQHQVGFDLYNESGGRAYAILSNGNYLLINAEGGSESSSSVSGVSHLRLRGSGDSVTLDYSSDGVAWIPIGTTTLAGGLTPVRLVVWSDVGDPSQGTPITEIEAINPP